MNKDLVTIDIDESKHISFIMFTPDALLQNAHLTIINDLNLSILLFKFVNISRTKAEQVYQKELITNNITSWWIKDKIFTKGLCCVLLVKGNFPAEYNSLCEYLLTRKGKSDPLLRDAGTIRDMYRVSNKSFGFMHSSDDINNAIYEASVFFTMDEIKKALFSKNSEHHLEVYSNCLKEESIFLSYYHVIYRIKEILLKEFKHTFPEFYTEHTTLFHLILDIYSEAKDITKRKLSFYEERILISRLLSKEREILEKVLLDKLVHDDLIIMMNDLSSCITHMRKDALILLLDLLSNEKKYSELDFDLLKKLLNRIPIYLDPWDELLLESSLFFYEILE
ncbi:nucleoside-diphosphate kinase [Paenibacillus pini]|uniref:Nucleoside diphosphate kinase-like domain-containing protein n=1 Tax=Paenibacillus pini JCM 16418 TaxID=1236976 RepID=W7YX18_9BACL|nr:nucleoside-diphosphate kinase [Paenibacillus pini]GAF09241.1 hypothetical protein JCM16418_3363 [Paenibacillus pini JCM 16418]